MKRNALILLAALPLIAGGRNPRPPVQASSCMVAPPWNGPPVESGTLVCFKGDPRAPYLIVTPVCVSGMPACMVTITRDPSAWIVRTAGPMGEPVSTVYLPLGDCIQIVSNLCGAP